LKEAIHPDSLFRGGKMQPAQLLNTLT
jgi:hypothetical protein